jgi:hypothetical protein
MPVEMTIIDAMSLAEGMPGTKNRTVVSLKKIDLIEYLEGKRLETENFFLKQMYDKYKAQ